MGPANPWSPNWRPDPTGRRALAIRASKRGAWLAAVLLGGLTFVALLLAPEVAQRSPLMAGVIALLTVPGLALLGAGLAPTALGSAIDAVAAGVALAIGAPVAAVTSAVIAIVCTLAIISDGAHTGESVGAVIRFGVLAAARVAPLLVAVVVIWIVGVRRLAPPAAPSGGSAGA